MPRPAYHDILDEAVRLEAEIGLAARVRVTWRPGLALPEVAFTAQWATRPPLTPEALHAIRPDTCHLGAELGYLYTQVSDGFATPNFQFPSAAELIAAWDRARTTAPPEYLAVPGGTVLVSLDDRNSDYVAFHEDRCEYWQQSDEDDSSDSDEDDDEDDDTHDPWGWRGSVSEGLTRVLTWPLRELRERRTERERRERDVLQRDFEHIAQPSELLACFWAASMARASGLPVLVAIAEDKLGRLIRDVRLDQMTRDVADTMLGQLINFARWDWVVALGDKCAPLFSETDRASLPYLRAMALGLQRIRPAEAIRFFEASIALGAPFHSCNIALCHLRAGDIAQAEQRASECMEPGFYCLDILGSIKAAAGKPAEAEAAYRRCIALYAPYAPAHLHLGALHVRQGDVERAEATLLRHSDIVEQLALQPSYFELLSALFGLRGDLVHANIARERANELTERARSIPLLEVSRFENW